MVTAHLRCVWLAWHQPTYDRNCGECSEPVILGVYAEREAAELRMAAHRASRSSHDQLLDAWYVTEEELRW